MTSLNQTEILWDKYKGVPDAYPGSSFIANQAVGTAIPQIVPESQVWNSTIPATAPTDLGSVVTITNGSYQQSASYPWIRKYTVTMGAIQSAGISYWYASTNINSPLTTNVCRESIPFNFDPLGSYNVQVFANGVAVSPTYSAYPWNYDGDAGVLTFFPASMSVLPATPITMTYWRYVGGKGGGSLLTYWTIEDPSPGSILYFVPSTGTAGNIYLNNDAQFLLSGPGCGYVLYDRTNTSAYWETWSTGNTYKIGYNGGSSTTALLNLTSAGVLSATSFSGPLSGNATTASTASTINTTTASTGNYYIALTNAGTGGTSKTVYTDAGLVYVASSDTLTIPNAVVSTSYVQNSSGGGGNLTQTIVNGVLFQKFSGTQQTALQTTTSPYPSGFSSGINLIIGDGDCGGTAGSHITSLALTDIASAQWAMSTASYNLNVLSDNFATNNTGNVWSTLHQIGNDGIHKSFTNTGMSLPMDAPIIELDNNVTFTSAGYNYYPDYTSYFTLANTTGNTWTITAYVNGNNPYARTISFSFNVAFNMNLVASTAVSTTQTPNVSSTSATINGGSFTGYTHTPSAGFGTAYTYTTSASSVWNVYQPIAQSSWVFTPTNTGNSVDVYVFTLVMTRTAAGGTMSVFVGPYGPSVITLNGATTLTKVLVSGTGTLTTSATPATTQLSVTRSTNTNAPISGVTLNCYGANFGDTVRNTQNHYNIIGALNSQINSGGFAYIQLGTANANYQSWFIGARNNTTNVTRLILSPYGVGVSSCWYVDGAGNTVQAGTCTADTFIGNATNITTTTQGTSSSYYLPTVASATGVANASLLTQGDSQIRYNSTTATQALSSTFLDQKRFKFGSATGTTYVNGTIFGQQTGFWAYTFTMQATSVAKINNGTPWTLILNLTNTSFAYADNYKIKAEVMALNPAVTPAMLTVFPCINGANNQITVYINNMNATAWYGIFYVYLDITPNYG